MKPRKTRVFLGYLKNAWDICMDEKQMLINQPNEKNDLSKTGHFRGTKTIGYSST
jgi:hypothetical protein